MFVSPINPMVGERAKKEKRTIIWEYRSHYSSWHWLASIEIWTRKVAL